MTNINGFEVYEWDEIEPALNEDCSLLLGNGFSIALLNGVFSYRQIASQINSAQYACGPNITPLLNTQNSNFESLMLQLENASSIVDAYGGTGTNCTTDAMQLRRDLISGITNLHPQLPLDPPIQSANYLNCGRFLKNFKKVFTTNYDTLLYWAIMKGRAKGAFDDGFRRDSRSGLLHWRESKDQNLFYLHGALHLFVRNTNWFDEDTTLNSVLRAPIIKLEMDAQDTILPQVLRHLRNGSFPLTVTEGHFHQKINRIVSSSYLRYGLEKFGSLNTDVLLSYGWSGGTNEDQHLYDVLQESQISCWLFGVYRPNAAELRRITRLVGALNGLRQRHQMNPIDLVFYDSSTFNPWS